MKNKIKLSLLAFASLSIISLYPQKAEAVCTPNPAQIVTTLGTLCWSCIFPLSVAGIQVVHGPMPETLKAQ